MSQNTLLEIYQVLDTLNANCDYKDQLDFVVWTYDTRNKKHCHLNQSNQELCSSCKHYMPELESLIYDYYKEKAGPYFTYDEVMKPYRDNPRCMGYDPKTDRYIWN